MKTELPPGCYRFTKFPFIIGHDIKNDRPCDVCDVRTNAVIRHGYLLKESKFLFWTLCWKVYSTTTYELDGKYLGGFMGDFIGGRRWAETDKTGLVWYFKNKKDAEAFAYGNN